MARISSVALLLVVWVQIAVGFISPIPSIQATSAVSRSATNGGMNMFFGGGGSNSKAKAKGININVRQKTGFKETTINIPAQKNLRKVLLDNKVDVYPLQGKIYNCGGGGSCGTCAVNVIDGAKNMSPKGPGEKKLLKDKPDSFRLSCCSMVKGDITIMTKP